MKHQAKSNALLDFCEFPVNGEAWEQFAREFLLEMNLRLKTTTGRGADQGKDLVVEEVLTGTFTDHSRSWLVSCKHNAHSDKAVGIDSESNIIDRVTQCGARGFIGFYSTVPSSALVERLDDYRQRGQIEAFELFDNRRIESILLQRSLTRLISTFFPISSREVRPIAVLFERYVPLPCKVCGTDLLIEDKIDNQAGIVVFEYNRAEPERRYLHTYAVCKGRCDAVLSKAVRSRGNSTSWFDISDIALPPQFADYVGNLITEWASPSYSTHCREDMRSILRAIAQRVMRVPTFAELERYRSNLDFQSVWPF